MRRSDGGSRGASNARGRGFERARAPRRACISARHGVAQRARLWRSARCAAPPGASDSASSCARSPRAPRCAAGRRNPAPSPPPATAPRNGSRSRSFVRSAHGAPARAARRGNTTTQTRAAAPREQQTRGSARRVAHLRHWHGRCSCCVRRHEARAVAAGKQLLPAQRRRCRAGAPQQQSLTRCCCSDCYCCCCRQAAAHEQQTQTMAGCAARSGRSLAAPQPPLLVPTTSGGLVLLRRLQRLLRAWAVCAAAKPPHLFQREKKRSARGAPSRHARVVGGAYRRAAPRRRPARMEPQSLFSRWARLPTPADASHRPSKRCGHTFTAVSGDGSRRLILFGGATALESSGGAGGGGASGIRAQAPAAARAARHTPCTQSGGRATRPPRTQGWRAQRARCTRSTSSRAHGHA